MEYIPGFCVTLKKIMVSKNILEAQEIFVLTRLYNFIQNNDDNNKNSGHYLT